MFPFARIAHRRATIFLGLALFFSLSSKIYAPIYGGFQGIDKLITEADVIVVATVAAKLSQYDFGGSAYYKIYRERLLKGSLEKETLTVNMRQLDMKTPALLASKNAALDDVPEFRIDSRYVLFLKEKKGDKKTRFENVNSEGSSFEVSRWFKLESLEGKPLKESLKLLLLDFRDYQRARLKHVDERTDILLGALSSSPSSSSTPSSPPPTETPSPAR